MCMYVCVSLPNPLLFPVQQFNLINTSSNVAGQQRYIVRVALRKLNLNSLHQWHICRYPQSHSASYQWTQEKDLTTYGIFQAPEAVTRQCVSKGNGRKVLSFLKLIFKKSEPSVSINIWIGNNGEFVTLRERDLVKNLLMGEKRME